MRASQWWDDTRRDLAQALRQLRRAPSFTVVAALTLALAIGANTAVFSVVDAVLLRPLPYPQPDRLVAVWARFLPPSGYDIPKATLGAGEVVGLERDARTFASMGAFMQGQAVALTGAGMDAQQVGVWQATASLLSVLGVTPALGRWFTEHEDAPDAPAVAVISHRLWSSRYGTDPGVVGRSVMMNGVATRVVGVLPVGFDLGMGATADAYLPLRLTASTRIGRVLGVIGRLAPDATLADANRELAALNSRWSEDAAVHPSALWAAPLQADRLGDAPDVLHLLLMAVGLVLLVACANVANLLLARGERRLAEVRLRAALGAGRGRIVRQFVTESLVLAAVASLLALPLSWMGTRSLVALDPSALPRLGDVHLGLAALLFTMGLAGVTTLLFGVAPAFLAARARNASPSASLARVVGGRRRGLLRQTLVAAEVAVSLVVVILAGLLVRSFQARASMDPGFRTADVLAFDLTLPERSYPEPEQVSPEYQRLLDELGRIPGIATASGASAAPFGRHMLRFAFWIDGRPPPAPGEPAWDAVTNFVMPDYFESLGIPMLAGRAPTPADGPGAPLVGVVNETMARTFWPGERALGKRWHYGPADGEQPWITVIGVVPDQIRYRVDEEALPEVYLSMLQAVDIGRPQRDLTVTLRAAVDPGSLAPAVRAAVKAFDPDLPVSNLHTMDAALGTSLARPRLTTRLLAVFAVLALALAMVGLYGVVSYSVSGRVREIGVRVALGADRPAVIGLVTREGAWPAAVGIALGLGAAWLATDLVRSMLFGVAPGDPLTFTVLPMGLLLVALAASLVPALRATRISPTEALREE